MLTFNYQQYESMGNRFYIDVSTSLSRLRVGRSTPADAALLFMIFTTDQLIRDRDDACRCPTDETDRSAEKLLLLMSLKRTLSHDRLNALQDTCDKAVVNISEATPSREEFVELQKKAAQTASAYADELEKALQTQRRPIDREIRSHPECGIRL